MKQIAVAGISGKKQGLQLCLVCGDYCPAHEEIHHCPHCNNAISPRIKHSLQKTWALLVTAIIFLIPANAYPITYLLKNNILYPDTIFSGIISLVDSDMPAIAFIVFIASIVVPIFKIVALAFIALAVQRRWKLSEKKQLWAFNFIDWVGRWSILDLFVISIMVAVFDKGHLLSVYPGVAATSFTIVVITTLFAAHCFDTRLIWDAQSNTHIQEQLPQDNRHHD